MTAPTEHHPDPHHETAPQHDPPDMWHDHAADARPQHAHGRTLKAKAVILIGIGLFITVMTATFVVYQYYVWYTTRMLNDRASPEQRVMYRERQDLRKRTLDQLDTEQPLWRDHDTVVVPLSSAMDTVIENYATEDR